MAKTTTGNIRIHNNAAAVNTSDRVSSTRNNNLIADNSSTVVGFANATTRQGDVFSNNSCNTSTRATATIIGVRGASVAISHGNDLTLNL